MELYKYINNEALSEDNKAKRIVMERIKKNLIDTQQSSFTEISPNDKKSFLIAYYNVSDEIDGTIYDKDDGVYSGNFEDVGAIPRKYNQLALIIQNMNFNNLNPSDKTYINGMMDKFIPKLSLIYNIAKDDGLLDAYQLKMIMDNIIARLYKPIFYDIKDNKQEPKSKSRETQTGRIAPGIGTQTDDNDDNDDGDNEGPEQAEIQAGQDMPDDQPNIPVPQPLPQAQVVNQAPQWWNYWGNYDG